MDSFTAPLPPALRPDREGGRSEGDRDAVIERFLSLARRARSIDQPGVRGLGDDAAALADTLGADDPGCEQAEHRATLSRLARSLSERDREVVRLRFEENLTQDAIGARMGISQMQVSRVLRAALQRLRAAAQP
jgi:RNA polymerase sigma-B factor